MAVLTDQERRELEELAASASLREDLQGLSRCRFRHFIREGRVNVDQVVTFSTDFNEMIKHQPKPFKKIIDHNMKL